MHGFCVLLWKLEAVNWDTHGAQLFFATFSRTLSFTVGWPGLKTGALHTLSVCGCCCFRWKGSSALALHLGHSQTSQSQAAYHSSPRKTRSLDFVWTRPGRTADCFVSSTCSMGKGQRHFKWPGCIPALRTERARKYVICWEN